MKDDTISRQAAIDALIRKIRPHNNGDGTITMCVMSEELVRKTLDDLPSAQPETHEERTETHACDCISRKEAIDALFELYEYQRDIDPTEAADLVRQGIFLAEKKIEKLPSAQPEIIRCKECLMHGVYRFEQGLGLDGYCSQAERRTDG